jgi:hypothetical protein
MGFDRREAIEPEVRHRLALKLRAAPPKRARAGVGYVQNTPFPDGVAPVPQRLVSRAGPSCTVVRGLLPEGIAARPTRPPQQTGIGPSWPSCVTARPRPRSAEAGSRWWRKEVVPG